MNDHTIELLSPSRGDVIVIHAVDVSTLSDEVVQQLAEQTGAVVLVLPDGTRIEELDEQEMARGGWVRIDPEIVEALKS